MMSELSLKFPKADLPQWARCYSYADDEGVLKAGERARTAGHFTKKDFLEVCEWKTRGRPRRYYTRNSEDDISRVTALALSSTDEPTRLWTLVAPNLKGVQMPTASVLLHLAVCDPTSAAMANTAYPIIDFRALWSLNCEKRRDTFQFWWRYVETCRALATEAGLSMRDLDRALWEYSNQNQRNNSCCT
jgi:hypothetical protein